MRLLLIILLSGCSPYWVKTHEPVEHFRTVYVDYPCGLHEVNGCVVRHRGIIELRKGMTEAEAWCALNHEKKHLAGYSHPGAHRGFAVDCGNGEIL